MPRVDNNTKPKSTLSAPSPFQDKSDWVKYLKLSMINGDNIGKFLGMRWVRSKRLSPLYHVSRLDMLWVIFYLFSYQGRIFTNMEQILYS